MTKRIALTRGFFALVDDEDYERVAQFRWCVQSSRKGNPYVVRGVNAGGTRRSMLMHRFIMGVDGEPATLTVDHINGDPLDNRRSNLRLCTNKENLWNQSARKGGTSEYRGVSWNRRVRKWTAFIGVDGKNKYLGCYIDEADAARAYNREALEYFGNFARLNDV